MVYSDSVYGLDMNQDLVFFICDAAPSHLVATRVNNCSSKSIVKMLLWGLHQKIGASIVILRKRCFRRCGLCYHFAMRCNKKDPEAVAEVKWGEVRGTRSRPTHCTKYLLEDSYVVCPWESLARAVMVNHRATTMFFTPHPHVPYIPLGI